MLKVIMVRLTGVAKVAPTKFAFGKECRLMNTPYVDFIC